MQIELCPLATTALMTARVLEMAVMRRLLNQTMI
jgi:hypothetical protein